MQTWYAEEYGTLPGDRRANDKQGNTMLFQGAAWDHLAMYTSDRVIRGLYCDTELTNQLLARSLRTKLNREFRLDLFGNVVSPYAVKVCAGTEVHIVEPPGGILLGQWGGVGGEGCAHA